MTDLINESKEKIVTARGDNTSTVMTLTGFVRRGVDYRVRKEGYKIIITPVKYSIKEEPADGQ